MINVLLPGAGAVTQMDEADLLKLEGELENDNERITWVQYHLKTTGDMVHRSAHVHLKLPLELAAVVAQL
jgi:hypothetical protein